MPFNKNTNKRFVEAKIQISINTVKKGFTNWFNWSKFLTFIINFWAITLCFPIFQSIFYVVSFIIILGILRGKLSLSFNLRNKLSSYCLSSYIVWMICTILWTENILEYFKNFEKLIPLILLTVISFTEGLNKYVNVKTILNMFLWGVLISVLYMLIRMGINIFKGDTIGQINVSGLMSLDLLSYISHRTYIGIVLLMAIPISYSQIDTKSTLNKLTIIILTIGLSLLCIMSSSRILMLLTVVIVVVSAFLQFTKVYNWKLKVIFSTLIIISVVSVALTNQRISSKLFMLKEKKSIEQVEVRSLIWPSTFELLIENPLIGYGIGDSKQKLIEKFEKNHIRYALDNKFNAHNQYMQTIIEGGIIGLFLFHLFIGVLITCKRNKNKAIFYSFLLIYGLAFMFESILVRNIGVFPITFWLFIFINFDNQKQFNNMNNKSSTSFNKITVSLFIIGGSFLLILFALPIKGIEPRTYMTKKYERVIFQELPNGGGFPFNTVGFSINFTEIINSREEYYQASPIFIRNLTSPDSLKVNFSIHAYVPSSIGIEDVYISINDQTKKIESHYDIENHSTWQELKISTFNSFKLSKFLIVVKLDRKNINDQGEVFFAFPTIKINDTVIIGENE